jgi:hypothetical protein
MKYLVPVLALLFAFSSVYACAGKVKIIPASHNDTTECIVCERIGLFKKVKELASEKIWKGLDHDAYIPPLLYFTESNTYVAFGQQKNFIKFKYDPVKCGKGLLVFKLM